MEFCSHNHRQVCFTGGNCPVCEVREDLEKQVNGLKDEVQSLEQRVTDLEMGDGE